MTICQHNSEALKKFIAKFTHASKSARVINIELLTKKGESGAYLDASEGNRSVQRSIPFSVALLQIRPRLEM